MSLVTGFEDEDEDEKEARKAQRSSILYDIYCMML
jgi:hypothetical protein